MLVGERAGVWCGWQHAGCVGFLVWVFGFPGVGCTYWRGIQSLSKGSGVGCKTTKTPLKHCGASTVLVVVLSYVCCLVSAVSYSPTTSRLQYHQR